MYKMSKTKNLFEPIVAANRLHPSFKKVSTFPGNEPAREMANEIFQDYEDNDGSFLEQFQTAGFDSRVFELYLYAYFSRSGYELSKKYSRPDFIVNKNNLSVAIEATTVNPTQGKLQDKDKETFHIPSFEEIQKKHLDELPIKFGSPLFSKLRKKYWELDHCKGLPIVLAIEAFHEKGSLVYSASSLSQYLYGLRSFPTWTENGEMIIESKKIDSHQNGEKVIPSNFFAQPDAEYISAILFSNSGTIPKFGRMGYQAGYHRGNIEMIRTGFCFNPDPNSAEPINFTYELDTPPVDEKWGQGLVVIHNPNALHPIPLDYFFDAAQNYLKNGAIAADVPPFHPFQSITFIRVRQDKEFYSPTNGIYSILRKDFDSFEPARGPLIGEVIIEKEWYANSDYTILGTITFDLIDDDWGFVVLGRDQKEKFRFMEGDVSLHTRELARKQLFAHMKKVMKSGQSVFPQD